MTHVVARGVKKMESRGRVTKFQVGDLVLIPHGKAVDKTTKWPGYKSGFYGPCKVTKAKHPLYQVQSPHDRHSRVIFTPCDFLRTAFVQTTSRSPAVVFSGGNFLR